MQNLTIRPAHAARVQREVFESELFIHFQNSPQALSQPLLKGLASLVKAAAAGDKQLQANGSQEFQQFFANAPLAAGCAQAYLNAPPTPASYDDLLTHGAPPSLCDVAKGDLIQEILLRVELEEDAVPERFAFDLKEGGYIERDSNGDWDTQVTKEKTFIAYWKRRFAEAGVDGLGEFLEAIPRFSRREYLPGERGLVFKHDGIWKLSTYRPGLLKPVAGSWDLYDQLTLHLAVGDRDAQAYFLDWLAAPLQAIYKERRALKTQVVVVLIRAHGTGKGLLSEALQVMYGASNFIVLGQAQIDSRFTKFVCHHLFIVANEITSSSNKSMETMNKLKAMATDETVASEGKFKDAGSGPTYFNMLVMANDARPVILEYGDRRYVVFDQTQPLDRALGKAIADDRAGSQAQLAAFFEHLLNRKVTFSVGDLFETDARKRLIAESCGSALKFAHDIKEEEWPAIAEHWWRREVTATWRYDVDPGFTALEGPYFEHDGLYWVRADWVREVYKGWCSRMGLKMEGGNKLWEALRQAMPEIRDGRPRLFGRQVRSWTGFPGVPDVQSVSAQIPLVTPPATGG
jgi:hypothetical protein